MQQNTDIRTWIKNCGAEWVQYLDLEADRVSTALILAIKFGDWESTQILAASSDAIDESDDDEGDWSALMYAVHEKCFKTVKLLMDLGADVNRLGEAIAGRATGIRNCPLFSECVIDRCGKAFADCR